MQITKLSESQTCIHWTTKWAMILILIISLIIPKADHGKALMNSQMVFGVIHAVKIRGTSPDAPLFCHKKPLKVYNHFTTTRLIIYEYLKNCQSINAGLSET